jgi:pimeloyl-ACP methyl ester carboxylesterase
MNHHIIYIPGLGDHYDGGRRLALRGWEAFGIKAELVPMQWYDGASYEDKFNQVVAAIQRAQLDGRKVTVIGESAGGSMAINVAARVPSIHKLITIGGVASPTMPVAASTLRKSPAFKDSIRELDTSLSQLDSGSAIVVRAAFDPIVHRKYSHIDGARDHPLPTVGHLTTIALCLTIYSRRIIRLVSHKA